jgi:hypothetical protein
MERDGGAASTSDGNKHNASWSGTSIYTYKYVQSGINILESGKMEGGRKLEVKVIGIEKRFLGAEHPDTLIIMSNLAFTYRSQGRLKEAEKLELQVRSLGSPYRMYLNLRRGLVDTADFPVAIPQCKLCNYQCQFYKSYSD